LTFTLEPNATLTRSRPSSTGSIRPRMISSKEGPSSARCDRGAVIFFSKKLNTLFPAYDRSRMTVFPAPFSETPIREARSDLPAPGRLLYAVMILVVPPKYSFPTSETSKPILSMIFR